MAILTIIVFYSKIILNYLIISFIRLYIVILRIFTFDFEIRKKFFLMFSFYHRLFVKFLIFNNKIVLLYFINFRKFPRNNSLLNYWLKREIIRHYCLKNTEIFTHICSKVRNDFFSNSLY